MTYRFADVLFWLAVACCAVGHVAILHSIVGTPLVAGERRSELRQRVAEIIWAVVPAIALAFVLIFTWRAMHPHVHVTYGLPANVATSVR